MGDKYQENGDQPSLTIDMRRWMETNNKPGKDRRQHR